MTPVSSISWLGAACNAARSSIRSSSRTVNGGYRPDVERIQAVPVLHGQRKGADVMHWLVVLMPFYAFPILMLLILLTIDRLPWRSGSRMSAEQRKGLGTFSRKVAPCI